MTDTTDNLDLSQPVSSLHGVGVRNLAKLERLGISTIRQLLWHLPARYEDYSAAAEISPLNIRWWVGWKGMLELYPARSQIPKFGHDVALFLSGNV